MLINNIKPQRLVFKMVIIFVVSVILVVAGIITLKYSVEGEKNMPFEISKLRVVSSANFEEGKEDELWKIEAIQNNDLYIYIQNNEEINEKEFIKKVTINNFQVLGKNEKGEVNAYKVDKENNIYTYIEENKILNCLEYNGTDSQTINKELKIGNQGGLVCFSVATTNLAKQIIEQNIKITKDGTFLKELGINEEDISFKFSFDLIIETETNNKFKTTILLELPTGQILENGVSSLELQGNENFIFKRI